MSSLIKPGSKPSPGVILLFVWCGLVLVACLGGIGYFLWLGYMNSSGKAYPPLHTAAIQGNLGEVQRLVESGAPLDGKDLHGNTALVDALQNVSAATGDQYGVAAYLISKGASVNNGTFRLAVGDGNAGIVKAIADRGVKADASLLADYVLWNKPNKKSIDLNIADTLLACGADINGLSSYTISVTGHNEEFTSLGLAVYHRDVALVRYLLEKGADANVPMEKGSTPLELAKTEKRFTDGGNGNGPGVNYYYYATESPEITELLKTHGAH